MSISRVRPRTQHCDWLILTTYQSERSSTWSEPDERQTQRTVWKCRQRNSTRIVGSLETRARISSDFITIRAGLSSWAFRWCWEDICDAYSRLSYASAVCINNHWCNLDGRMKRSANRLPKLRARGSLTRLEKFTDFIRINQHLCRVLIQDLSTTLIAASLSSRGESVFEAKLSCVFALDTLSLGSTG